MDVLTNPFLSFNQSLLVKGSTLMKKYGPAHEYTLIARFMGPTWGPSGADRTQVGPMLAPWTFLSGYVSSVIYGSCNRIHVYRNQRMIADKGKRNDDYFKLRLVSASCPYAAIFDKIFLWHVIIHFIRNFNMEVVAWISITTACFMLV